MQPQAGELKGAVLRLRGTFIDTDEMDCEARGAFRGLLELCVIFVVASMHQRKMGK